MSISNKISRDHILMAMKRIDNEGIPIRRHAKKWHVVENGQSYPCKLLISWANFFANHTELSSNDFVTDEAQIYLQNKNFKVLPLKSR